MQSRGAGVRRGVVVTVRATTLVSATAGEYYVEEIGGYYVAGGEPPGRWLGRGAARVGLSGEVDPQSFINLMGGLDPSGAQVLGRRYGERSVRCYDVTCSAPKSASVLWAVGDDRVRAEVLAAHDAAVDAVAVFIDEQATTRPTIGGRVLVVDAEGITAAAFRQHTSRASDPQLHTHLVVAAKVQDPDGRWLALDGRVIKCDQRTLSAIYHAGLRAELTRRLGVTWHPPKDGIAEIAGIDPGVLKHFSKRTADHAERLAAKLDRFEQRMGRAPTRREHYRLDRQAVLDSRPPKPKGQTPAVLHAGWRRELAALGYDPPTLTASATGSVKPAALSQPAVGAMVDQALAALSEHQSTWRRNDLIRELARAVPTALTVEPARLVGWLEDVADHVIAHQLIEYAPPAPAGIPRRRDGRPITETTLHRRFTTPAVVAEEDRILASIERRTTGSGRPGPVDCDGLDVAQVTVAQTVAGAEQLVLVVGPAGTGKTSALGPAIASLRAQSRFVVGAAPSATAAAVLSAETGMPADTIDKLLHDHRDPTSSSYPGGTTVVVDEAGMLATPKLRELLELADAHYWRVVLVGDPLQLSAVGRGGMFGLLTKTQRTVNLERVHRFAKTWERAASLALRAGNSVALDDYDAHGRLHDGTSRQVENQIVEQWANLRRDGSVAVLCATNEGADRLNTLLQAQRIAAREVDAVVGRALRMGSAHVGDVVATRRNDRRLVTDRGVMVKNRARWTVSAISSSGSLTLTGPDGRITLPSSYVDDHVRLAYAETIHAAQGRTVEHGLLFVDGPTDSSAIYVGLTRGRRTNHAYVATKGPERAADIVREALSQSWGDRPAHEVQRALSPEPAMPLQRDAVGLSL